MEPIDLTLTISPELQSFPGSPNPQFIPWAKIRTNGYNLELLFLSSHTGTHIDAPFHFMESGFKIHVLIFILNKLNCLLPLLEWHTFNKFLFIDKIIERNS